MKLLELYNEAAYKAWKRKNVTIRGVSTDTGSENNGGAMLGRGLYTAFLSNTKMAKSYGQVYFVYNAIPKKPKIFNTLNEWEIWEYDSLIKPYCIKNNLKVWKSSFFENTTIEDEVQKLGYDGIIIKGREMVNYKPKDFKYFKTEAGLRDFYEQEIS